MEELTFRRLGRADFPLLRDWLTKPHVARWWNHDSSAAAVDADFGPSIDGADPAELFIAALSGRPIGFVQRYRFADNPRYLDDLEAIVRVPVEALSIDYFIGERHALGRGLATAMIRAATAAIWQAHVSAPAVIVPVSAANTASWRVLERAGFTRIAEGALEPDNPIDDPRHFIYRIDRPDDAAPTRLRMAGQC